MFIGVVLTEDEKKRERELEIEALAYLAQFDDVKEADGEVMNGIRVDAYGLAIR